MSLLPTARPANCASAPLPTISSRRPGLNLRPSSTCTSGRRSHTRGPTPRSSTLASVLVDFFGRLATTTTSGEAMGLPSALRSTPWPCSMTLTSSRVRPLFSSAVAPARMTMAWSMRPVLASVAWKPSPMASRATSTPTTPAMPTTITAEAPRRSGMVLTPTQVTFSAWRPLRVAASQATRASATRPITASGRNISTTIAAIRATRPRNCSTRFIAVLLSGRSGRRRSSGAWRAAPAAGRRSGPAPG